VFNVAQFWDGRAADLKAQAKGPVQASVEMNATPDRVIKTLDLAPEERLPRALSDQSFGATSGLG
jgi:cytochrome c peroxidase